MGLVAEILSNLLLFLLVFGMSATVDIGHMRAQLSNKKAFLTGLFLQFVILPFLGFIVVKALKLEPALGITLLVVTSSPGGSYSNWWCSLFNADLALSVAMTAISTILSIAMLPLNLYIYASRAYETEHEVMEHLDWAALFVALIIVIVAIGSGLYCSARENSPRFNMYANRFGNLAGIALILLSTIFASTGGDDDSAGIVAVWQQSPRFYIGVASPCVLGLIIANLITTYMIQLKEAERVTVAVECCYQNIGIATSVAISMFDGSERAVAMSVPLFYGIVEAVVLGIYCIWAWKRGWTKAPKDDAFYKVLVNSYEVEESSKDLVSDQDDQDTQSSDGTQRPAGRSPPLSPSQEERRDNGSTNASPNDSAATIRHREVLDEEIEVPGWIT